MMDSTSGDENIIICDQGTGFMKVGYAGENIPRHEFPSLVGRPVLQKTTTTTTTHGESPHHTQTNTPSEIVCGFDAFSKRDTHSCTYPIDGGIIRDWDSMSKLWNHAFNDSLEISNCSDKKILLTEPPLNPISNRNKIIEEMFESFRFGAVNLSLDAILILYARGLLTGMVIDSGEGVTHVVPVYEGFVPQHLIKRFGVSGRDLTRYLIKLLQLRGYNFSSISDFETVRQIKEHVCYAAYDLEEERRLARETTVLVENYTLPDGKVIQLERERFEATEALFDPCLIDLESKGLGDFVFDTVQEANIDCRLEYFKHIVLSGGSTLFPGLSNRLEKDIRQRYLTDILKNDTERLKKFKLNIEDPPMRKNLVFMGASVLANLMKHRDEFWMTKAVYDEEGAERAFAKCRI